MKRRPQNNARENSGQIKGTKQSVMCGHVRGQNITYSFVAVWTIEQIWFLFGKEYEIQNSRRNRKSFPR